MPFIIAIDGPSGVGKGTLARRLAGHLDYDFLETGKLYRLLALKIKQLAIADTHPDIPHIIQNIVSEDLNNQALRNEKIAILASDLAKKPHIRALLRDFQQYFAAHSQKGAILEGRDIGTVICPNADHKIFLDASVEIRAERRYKELLDLDPLTDYMRVLDGLRRRDQQDRTRKEAPLRAADDAIIIDTGEYDAGQVFDIVLANVEKILKEA